MTRVLEKIRRVRNSPKVCDYSSQRGITLMEVIVSLVLSGMIVLMGTEVYRYVLSAGRVAERGFSDWSHQQFLRNQFKNIPQALLSNEELIESFRFTPTSLQMITTTGALNGQSGVPVAVRYAVRNDQLTYREAVLPNWWLSSEDREDVPVIDTSMQSQLESPSLRIDFAKPFIMNVSRARFSYFDPFSGQWQSAWQAQDRLPALVRLDVTKGGEDNGVSYIMNIPPLQIEEPSLLPAGLSGGLER